MAIAGLVSRDVVSKTRIQEILKEKGIEVFNINNSAFDGAGFKIIFVDLADPLALLTLRSHAHKCIAFGSANDESKLKAARLAGCDQVYKHGEFFKKILPNFKI